MIIEKGFWNFYIGNSVGKVTFYGKFLLALFGRRIVLHKMVGEDEEGCFHTHPAYAIRIILWGGYIEEHFPSRRMQRWRPGMIGLVRPEFAHRIHRLRNGKASYSLWIRGKKIAPINLVGDGWKQFGDDVLVGGVPLGTGEEVNKYVPS